MRLEERRRVEAAALMRAARVMIHDANAKLISVSEWDYDEMLTEAAANLDAAQSTVTEVPHTSYES